MSESKRTGDENGARGKLTSDARGSRHAKLVACISRVVLTALAALTMSLTVLAFPLTL